MSWVHKIRLHGRRGKETAESFSRQKLRVPYTYYKYVFLSRPVAPVAQRYLVTL